MSKSKHKAKKQAKSNIPLNQTTTKRSVAFVESAPAKPAPAVSASVTASAEKRPLPWGQLSILGLLCVGLIALPFLMPVSDPTANGQNQVSIWLVFLIGLTTGGLSCMIVQGGLLATTIAQREKDLVEQGTAGNSSGQAGQILAFLGAKLVAYTLLGLALGWLGSLISLTATAQAVLNLLAGLFMLATAFNLLELHPIFRYFAIQPPRWIMRGLRQQSKSATLFAPALLGFLTVLIPCGTTQAMEVLAISSGSPFTGSLIMAAFVLGTSPVFFVLGYFATKLGAVLQKRFLKFAALAIIVLSVLSINGALTVLDSPVTLEAIGRNIFKPTQETNSSSALPVATVTPVPIAAATQKPDEASANLPEVRINVTNTAYQPANVQVAAGQPFKLVLVTKNTFGCTRGVLFRSLGIQKNLPATGETVIEVPAQKPGLIRYTCTMGMYTGSITVA